MDKSQKARDNMYLRIRKVLTEFEAVWSSITPIVGAIAEFDQYRAELSIYKELQERDITGHSRALKAFREECHVLFMRLRNALVSFSANTHNYVLNEEVDYTKTSLKKDSALESYKRYGILLKLGQVHSGAMVDYDLDGAFLSDCTVALNKFYEHIGNYDNALLKRTLATESIKEQIKKMQDFLKDELDPSIGVFLGTEFEKRYTKARRIKEIGSRKEEAQSIETPIQETNDTATNTETTNDDTLMDASDTNNGSVDPNSD